MKKRYLIIILLVSMLAGCDKSASVVEIQEQKIQSSEMIDVTQDKQQELKRENVYVYICGQVKQPGVYQVAPTARIYHVLEKAGGFTKKAKKDALNLAEPVSDGEEIYVLSEKEYQKRRKEEANPISETAGTQGVVDLNCATQQELMTLPGIGASKAQAIIEYREKNGRFTKIEDLKNVSGIGDATFSNIKSMIAID